LLPISTPAKARQKRQAKKYSTARGSYRNTMSQNPRLKDVIQLLLLGGPRFAATRERLDELPLIAFAKSADLKDKFMPAYVISDIASVEQPLFERYRALAEQTILEYGGRYLTRTGATETVEGDWKPYRVVVLEFPSMERAREWYKSPEYGKALEISRVAVKRRMIFVEGVTP
jgi:uncharacterized protein (DUF1330 family)